MNVHFCIFLAMPKENIGTHAATCDRVVPLFVFKRFMAFKTISMKSPSIYLYGLENNALYAVICARCILSQTIKGEIKRRDSPYVWNTQCRGSPYIWNAQCRLPHQGLADGHHLSTNLYFCCWTSNSLHSIIFPLSYKYSSKSKVLEAITNIVAYFHGGKWLLEKLKHHFREFISMHF